MRYYVVTVVAAIISGSAFGESLVRLERHWEMDCRPLQVPGHEQPQPVLFHFLSRWSVLISLQVCYVGLVVRQQKPLWMPLKQE